jgi:hypothetical protein
MQITAASMEITVFVNILNYYTWYQNNFGGYTHVFMGEKSHKTMSVLIASMYI